MRRKNLSVRGAMTAVNSAVLSPRSTTSITGDRVGWVGQAGTAAVILIIAYYCTRAVMRESNRTGLPLT